MIFDPVIAPLVLLSLFAVVVMANASLELRAAYPSGLLLKGLPF